MGLFNIFRKKKKRKRHSRSPVSRAKPVTKKIGTDIDNLQMQISTINIALKKHDDELSEHTRLIGDHTNGLEKLEQMLDTPPISQAAHANISSSDTSEMVSTHPATESTMSESAQKFDVNRFSEQEKRILSVFFQNKGTRLSYVDVARTLNKSAHTIKNQMRQIREKADLFDQTVGDQCRNLFKLKDDLRIEKYLNIGRSIEQPLSTTWAIQSSGSG